MERKKALLVIAGGRGAPDVLPLHWIQPQLVRVILSKQGWDYKDAFIDKAHSIPGCQIDVIPDVDAYDLDAGIKACREACEPYPDTDWDWTFTIGSAPKITGIAAYEVAKEKGIPCWHIDVQGEHLISLVKTVEVDKEKFFHLTLDDYMKIQHRTWKINPGPTGTYRETVKNWAGIVRELVVSPDTAELLAPLRDKKVGVEVHLPSRLTRTTPLQAMVGERLITVRQGAMGNTICTFTSEEAAKFIGTGDWLEFYVWHEAVRSGLADDLHCQWGCSIFDGPVEKELDLALMYKAQLIVAECKAERSPYQAPRGHLHKLQAKANVLGGLYVCKLFITSQQAVGDSYKSFKEQAEQYKIVVVTKERLPEIGQILRREATTPSYQRI